MAREGDTIDGRYLLRRMLGDGGMGHVFLAENVRLGNKAFAVKTLKPEYLSNKEVVGRFLEEALAASKVEHDNIVEVFDADVDAATGTPFIVQRYLRGTNLREHLDACQGRRLRPDEALEYLVPIMGALVATHKQRIIHRDIKPENIFLVKTSSGNTVPKLIDFGIAKHLEPQGSARRSDTRSGSIWGTFDYMSPEQARGEAGIDVRADIWSMGSVLFEAVTGRLPYQVESHAELLQRFAEGPPPRVESLCPELPGDLSDAIARALQIDPSKRWPTMAAFISALINCGSYQSTVAWRAIPLSSPDLSAVPDLTSLARPATEEHPSSLRSQRPAAVVPGDSSRSRRARGRAATVSERLEPGMQTLQHILPERWSARRALPYVVGVAAVLVGVVLGMQLRTAPPSVHAAPAQRASVASSAVPATPREVAALPLAPPAPAPLAVPAAPVVVTPQTSAATPEADVTVAPRRVRAPRVRTARARPASTAPHAAASHPVIQTEF